MNTRTKLMSMGAAVILAFAAQAAQAQTCPTEGDHQVEVGQDGETCGSLTPIIVVAENADGVEHTITGEVPNGQDFLQIGEVVEVEIEYDDILAALKADEKNALALAAAVGLHPAEGKSAVIDTAHRAAKATLTDAEYRALASHMHVSLQNRSRASGRSDPASNSFTRRIDAYAQAFGRMMNSIGRNLPSLNYRSVRREFNEQGVMVSEESTELHIGRSN